MTICLPALVIIAGLYAWLVDDMRAEYAKLDEIYKRKDE